MFLGKVVGTVWSTKKTPDLEGIRFLVVHPYDLEKEPTRNIVIVADRLGAGTGEIVMCAFGKAARTAMGNQEMAIEAAVVGIVDRLRMKCAKRRWNSREKTAAGNLIFDFRLLIFD
jgi:ethanolamine utilization protein EutN